MRSSVRVPEDRVAIQQELQSCLAKPINEARLAQEIATLLEAAGRKIERRVLAQRLAQAFASRFTQKSYDLQELIKYRPEELSALKDAAVWEHIKTEVLPMIERQKKRPAKLQTPEERLRRIKRAKNLHEMVKRSHIPKPGAIERDFSVRSALFPPGPCLDEIFRGGRYPMCGADSLQWLFGLTRKKLCMAKPEIWEGRRCFYDYRGVLACMAALLKGTGSHADWLPDPGRRRIVLTGILFRARQEASATIARAFERTLGPHLT